LRDPSFAPCRGFWAAVSSCGRQSRPCGALRTAKDARDGNQVEVVSGENCLGWFRAQILRPGEGGVQRRWWGALSQSSRWFLPRVGLLGRWDPRNGRKKLRVVQHRLCATRVCTSSRATLFTAAGRARPASSVVGTVLTVRACWAYSVWRWRFFLRFLLFEVDLVVSLLPSSSDLCCSSSTFRLSCASQALMSRTHQLHDSTNRKPIRPSETNFCRDRRVLTVR
jgi:hypothetical protein